jgi:hypothetical protein
VAALTTTTAPPTTTTTVAAQVLGKTLSRTGGFSSMTLLMGMALLFLGVALLLLSQFDPALRR